MKKANTLAGDFNTAITLDDAGMALGPGPGTGAAEPAESGHTGTPFSDNGISYDPATGLYHDDGETFPLNAAGSASLNNGSSSPVASIPTLATWLTNGFWTNQGALPHHWASNTITYNLGNLNAQEQALALSALKAWSEVANINFVQVSSGANINFNHNGTMQAVTNASWNGSGQMTSATIDISTDWVTTDGGANDGKTGIDSYAYQTYIHEIGHSLGLGHQGPYNGSATYANDAIYANDTWQFSIMSYFSESNYSGSSYRYVITPQMADIYAAQSIYGVQTNTRPGDTVYGFNNTAGSPFDFTAYTQAPALTIYDSGGNDTLDCSGYSNNQTIDLHAGSFSSVGGLKNNIGIALGVNIEKAIGGSGNDTLIANDNGCTLVGGGGADTLIGGAGKDTMTGSAGADIFVFNSSGSSPASGQHDLIPDFTSADDIDVSAMGTFHFLGTAAFDGSNFALDYVYNSSTGITTVLGDINGDKVADFAIDLTGNIALNVGNFVGVQAAPVVIESFGSTSLVQVGNYYYFYPVNGSSGPQFKYNGSPVSVGQYPSLTFIAAEQTASGYEVAIKVQGADQYTVWNTDNNGNVVSNATGGVLVSGSSSVLESLEPSFQQDLNGDGVIGAPAPAGTAIESFGSTSLVQVGNYYYFYPVGGSSGPQFKYIGSPVSVGQYPSLTFIAAEQTASGYEVAIKVQGADQYTVWNTDNNGNVVSNGTGGVLVSGSSSVLESLEPSFHQDLNGDGVIGAPAPAGTVIESFGSTSLVQVGNYYYFYPVGGSSGPQFKYNGSPVSVGQYPSLTFIAAEQTASGYEVAIKIQGADQYTVWNTDNNGNVVSNGTGGVLVSGSSSVLKSLEPSFHQDLNGDGVIGSGSATAPTGAASPDISQAAQDFGPNDVFLFRTDFGVQTGGADSVRLAEYSAPFANANFEALLKVAQDLVFQAANGHQDAIVDVSNHDGVKLQAFDLHAGFLFLQ